MVLAAARRGGQPCLLSEDGAGRACIVRYRTGTGRTVQGRTGDGPANFSAEADGAVPDRRVQGLQARRNGHDRLSCCLALSPSPGHGPCNWSWPNGACTLTNRLPLSPGRRGLRGRPGGGGGAGAGGGADAAAVHPRGGGPARSVRRAGGRGVLAGARFAVGVHPHQAHECGGGRSRPRRWYARRARPFRRRARRRGDRPRLPLRLLAARRAAGGVPRAGARWRASSVCPVVIHTREAEDDTLRHPATRGRRRRRGCLPLLHRRRALARRGARPRVPPLVRRHRHVSEGRGAARGGARSCPPIGCWSRPTARSWRRCRTAASATSRRTWRASSRRWPTLRTDARRSTAIDAQNFGDCSAGDRRRMITRAALTPRATYGQIDEL